VAGYAASAGFALGASGNPNLIAHDARIKLVAKSALNAVTWCTLWRAKDIWLMRCRISISPWKLVGSVRGTNVIGIIRMTRCFRSTVFGVGILVRCSDLVAGWSSRWAVHWKSRCGGGEGEDGGGSGSGQVTDES
jgi:hypothetical protein